MQRAISWVRIPLIAGWGGWFAIVGSTVVTPISVPGKAGLSVAEMPRIGTLGITSSVIVFCRIGQRVDLAWHNHCFLEQAQKEWESRIWFVG